MKKLTLIALLGLFFMNVQVFAGNGDLFTYDKEKVATEMTELNALESMLLQDQSLDYEQLLLANSPLIQNLDLGVNHMSPGMGAGPIVPSFWWGCITGPLGVLIVYLYEDDRTETRSAIWGCIIWAILTGGAGWFGSSSGWF